MFLSRFLKLFLFLLPWQTMWIYREPFLNGGKWEYGALGYYATEVLLWMCIGLFMLEYLKKIQDTRYKIQFQFSKDRIFFFVSLLFIIYLLFSAARSLDSALAMQQSIRIIEAFFLFLMLFSGGLSASKAHPPRAGYAAFWFIAGAIIPSILGIWQFLSQSTVASTIFGLSEHAVSLGGASVIAGEEIGRVLRAYGSFSHPNVFGGYLVMVLLILFLQNFHVSRMLEIKKCHPEEPRRATKDLSKHTSLDFIRTRRIQKHWLRQILHPAVAGFRMTLGIIIQSKIICYICIGILTSGLFFSFSRSAWVAYGILMALIFGTHILSKSKKYSFNIRSIFNPPRQRRAGSYGQYAIFSLAIFFILSCIYFPLVQTRLTAETPHEIRSTTERVSGYKEAIGLFKEHPWFGIGPGNYTRALIKKDPTRPGWEYQPVHNVPLLALVEFGVVGMFFLMAGIVSFIMYQISCIQKHVSHITYHVSLLMILIPPLFLDHYLLSSYTGLMLLGVLAGILFSFQNEERSAEVVSC